MHRDTGRCGPRWVKLVTDLRAKICCQDGSSLVLLLGYSCQTKKREYLSKIAHFISPLLDHCCCPNNEWECLSEIAWLNSSLNSLWDHCCCPNEKWECLCKIAQLLITDFCFFLSLRCSLLQILLHEEVKCLLLYYAHSMVMLINVTLYHRKMWQWTELMKVCQTNVGSVTDSFTVPWIFVTVIIIIIIVIVITFLIIIFISTSIFSSFLSCLLVC